MSLLPRGAARRRSLQGKPGKGKKPPHMGGGGKKHGGSKNDGGKDKDGCAIA